MNSLLRPSADRAARVGALATVSWPSSTLDDKDDGVTLRVAMAQVAARVGDVDGNVELVLDAWRRAAEQGADLVVFTELTITGYPPEDLLLKPEFLDAAEQALDTPVRPRPRRHRRRGRHGRRRRRPRTPEDEESGDVSVPALDLRNRAVALADGEVAAIYDKWRLPNYGVFDEARYFVPDDEPASCAWPGCRSA